MAGASEKTEETQKRDVKLWCFETETEDKKKGVRLMRSLSGSARAIVDSLTFDELACESGMENIMKALREQYKPHLEVSLDFQDYIIRMDQAHTKLIQEGVKLPSEARGYIYYRQNKFDYDRIIGALRKLDKVLKEDKTKSKNTVDVFAEYEGLEEHPGNQFEDAADDGGSEEDYVYLQEGDLQEMYEEGDVMEALATYKKSEVRSRPSRRADSTTAILEALDAGLLKKGLARARARTGPTSNG
ncbi:unnamed protein product [Effrenium voratum]|nr:unnamed protein product [Effrenium voratum]